MKICELKSQSNTKKGDEMMEKTTYITEITENEIKTKRIDELENGVQTNSTILQSKDSINLQMNKNHQYS